MVAKVGTQGVVKVGTATVAEVLSFSLEETAEVVEDTPLGETAKTFISDRTAWSGSVTCQWDKSDSTGQEAMTLGGTVTLHLHPEGAASGDADITGSVIITGITRSVAAGEVITREFTFQGTADMTETTVV